MAETTNYQCPSCNGRMVYNGELGKLQCEFCGSAFTPQEIEALYAEMQAKADAEATKGRMEQLLAEAGVDADSISQAQMKAAQDAFDEGLAQGKAYEQIQMDMQAAVAAATEQAAPAQTAAQASTSDAVKAQPAVADAGDPIATYLQNAKRHDVEAEGLRSFTCSACAAQLMVDQVTAVTSCPYCGNNTVLPGQLSDVLQPDYVIPFKLDKQAAVDALHRYYGGKRFLPSNFTDENHIEEVQGLYVPFWLYSGTGSADVEYRAENVRAWSDSKYDYVDTDHFAVYRSGHMDFRRVPVDGSTKMPDAHMDAIEPFDYSEMVPFSMGYLPGYVTDRYDQDAKKCEFRMKTRVQNTCVDALQDTVTGYESVRVKHADSNMALSEVSYALLPVWMLHTRWNDTDYLFAMNGQTGRLVGDLPVDKGKVVRGFLLVFVPVFVIVALLVYFIMGFGV